VIYDNDSYGPEARWIKGYKRAGHEASRGVKTALPLSIAQIKSDLFAGVPPPRATEQRDECITMIIK
jgi:hypothetical protein